MIMNNDEDAQVTSRLTTEALLLALIALEVDRRESNLTDGQVKTELLLDSVGLSYQQIARIMGKNSAAVRMAITRAKKKPQASNPKGSA